MINPSKITQYNLSIPKLEERLLFWILVAGKTAETSAKSLDQLLFKLKRSLLIKKNISPFDLIKEFCYIHKYHHTKLQNLMKSCGIGCYTSKARSFIEIAHSDINLKTCTVNELEKIYGIGKKTSRGFIMHSRQNSQYACLDVHILRYLRNLGYNVPTSTPSSDKQYTKIEKEFIKLAHQAGKSPAEFDLKIWKKYAGVE